MDQQQELKNSSLYIWGVPFSPLNFMVKTIGTASWPWFYSIHPQAFSLRARAGKGTVMPSNLLTGKHCSQSWASLKLCLNLSSLWMVMCLPWILHWNELFLIEHLWKMFSLKFWGLFLLLRIETSALKNWFCKETF